MILQNEDIAGRDFLNNLPVEIGFKILSMLDVTTLVACRQVSQKWASLCKDELLWAHKCAELKITNDWKNPFEDKSGSYLHRCVSYHKLIRNWCRGSIEQRTKYFKHKINTITALVNYGDNFIISSDTGAIYLIRISTGSFVRLFTDPGGAVWAIALISSPIELIASASKDCSIRLWHADTGAYVGVLTGHHNIVRCIVSSPDGTKLISGSRDARVYVWDVLTCQCLFLLSGHEGAIHCVRVDEQHIVSGSYDNTVRVWDLKTGECLAQLIGHTDRVYTVHLGRRVILSSSLDTIIRIWSRESYECIFVLEGHESLTCQMALNRDESLVVSGNADGTARVWRIDTGQCLFEMLAEWYQRYPARNSLTSISIVFDRFVVGANMGGHVSVWDLCNGSLVRTIIPKRHYSDKTHFSLISHCLATDRYLICGLANEIGTNIFIVVDFAVNTGNND